jgi:hypothetical protein
MFFKQHIRFQIRIGNSGMNSPFGTGFVTYIKGIVNGEF